MAYVRVEQRNARLASAIKVDQVKGRDGEVAKGTVTIISNVRRGTGEDRSEEATAIQWTLWGPQAENAAAYLGKGSRVNVIGRVQNNNYTDGDGRAVYGMSFTCEELDYLDSKAETAARTKGQSEWTEAYASQEASTKRRDQPQGRLPNRRAR